MELPAPYAYISTEDGPLVIEWPLSKDRVGIVLDTEAGESSWFVASKEPGKSIYGPLPDDMATSIRDAVQRHK